MLQAISPCTQANSEWMFAWNNSHKLSGGKIYHATSPKSEFRAGSSCCIENRNCCCFIRYSLLLCVLFFPSFFHGRYRRRKQKKDWERSWKLPCAHALLCNVFSSFDCKIKNTRYRVFPDFFPHRRYSGRVGGNDSVILVCNNTPPTMVVAWLLSVKNLKNYPKKNFSSSCSIPFLPHS